ncbi:hypothetical protein BEWA_050560 [Theileria equi strain WA]|uniref:Signal peptide containing protein n=1 Tax=Theileria equi strain WA TaxID=1537102 RepID=L1LBN4_THEEQ|nr:hypothetical protein BEWA_050560 [Theileria equi strain WA]EKX72588.1 hypothetical protein BEWA_050560 [Theileria equi strain WA]|eukprot:XP_004832040.1 hypothetical protein BEWA_050560 [Theileria equi strain WA]
MFWKAQVIIPLYVIHIPSLYKCGDFPDCKDSFVETGQSSRQICNSGPKLGQKEDEGTAETGSDDVLGAHLSTHAEQDIPKEETRSLASTPGDQNTPLTPKDEEISRGSTAKEPLFVHPQEGQMDQSTKKLPSSILDLANIDSSTIYPPKTIVNDSIATYYYPAKKGFERIVDGEETIWKGEKEEKCVVAYTILKGDKTILILLIRGDKESNLVYYRRDSGGYWSRLEREKRNVPIYRAIKLDISSLYPFAFSILQYTRGLICTKKYTAKAGYRIDEVRDGDSELWKSDSPDKHCTLATVHLCDNSPKLATLIINHSGNTIELRRRKRNGKWVDASEERYGKFLEGIEKTASLQEPKNVQLDIDNVDSSIFAVESTKENGVAIKTFFAKAGYHLTRIVQTIMPIWTSVYKRELCLTASFYFGKNGPVAAAVRYKDKNGKRFKGLRIVYDHGWKVAGKSDFYNVIDRIKCRSDSPEPWTTVRPQPLPPPPPPDPVALDISKPDLSIYKRFDYHLDSIPTTFILPQRNVTITKVINGDVTVWTPEGTQKFYYAKLSFKDGIPKVAQIVSEIDAIYAQHQYYKFKGGVWKELKKFNDEIENLKIKTIKKGNFAIRIEVEESNQEYKIFETGFGNIPARSYVPNPGYHAKEIKFGERVIWKASGNYKRCIRCTVYFRTTPYILLIVVRKSRGTDTLYFEKVGFIWEPRTAGEFYTRLGD